MSDLRIIGVIDEDPFHFRTWSGLSRFFFKALQKEGVLVEAVSADAGAMIRRLAQIISFSPNKKIWKQKYHLNTFLFDNMTRAAARKIGEMADLCNTILQVGAWYNFSNVPTLKEKFLCSYHDGNLWAQIKRVNSRFSVNAPYVRKALKYEQMLYDRLDLIFPMSNWLREIFIEDFKCSPKKVIAVGAGVNFHSVPEIHSKDYEKPKIIFVGVHFERKGGYTLLEAFRTVRKAVPKAELTIIGPELTSLPSGVRCIGRVNKDTEEGEARLHSEYLNASLFVMPSQYEPFGVVFGEAMAHKLPCIGTDVCAMPEIIEDGKTGFIVPANDSKKLADAIIMMLRDPDKMKKFGEAGYNKYLKEFTWESVARKITHAISNWHN
jgi:glycosyltransferase involved in cell wall biosynthesis